MAAHVAEMKLAAELVQRDDFMGRCESGLPQLALEDTCRFCGATAFEKCKRANQQIRPLDT